jgi:hypothetical protein
MFRYKNNIFTNEKGQVITIQGNRDEENRNIIVSGKTNALNQQFEVVYQDQYPGDQKKGELNKEFNLNCERPFYLVNGLRSERYLDYVDNRNLVIKTQNGFNSQEFYFDCKEKCIRSVKERSFCWSMDKKGGSSNMKLESAQLHWYYIVKWDGVSSFYNPYDDRVLDVEGGKDAEGQNVMVFKKNKSKSQVWKLIYKDEAKAMATSGMSDFGFKINKTFYILSKLPMQRAMQCTGGVTLQDFNRAASQQKFSFDGASKTLKCQGQSMEITNRGKGPEVRIATTNSRWW